MTKRSERPDRERRARQAERLGRLFQLLRLIAGRGRWKINDLAAELECSERTIYRLLEALTASGVPWYFDKGLDCYRLREGYKLASLGEKSKTSTDVILSDEAEMLIAEGRKLASQLQNFINQLENLRS